MKYMVSSILKETKSYNYSVTLGETFNSIQQLFANHLPCFEQSLCIESGDRGGISC